jgi:iron complex outermembrane recepter protein
MRRYVLYLCAVLIARVAIAQDTGSISGTVIDEETQSPLTGANVVLQETPRGTSTDAKGDFVIGDLFPGRYDLTVSYIGYRSRTTSVTVAGDSVIRLRILLSVSMVPGEPITVTATRGTDRETPVTFTTLEHQEILTRYTTQDIPVLLSELPSTTYYSESGNGIGYTYLNIRGFDARRIAVMVNGIPQNDPEDHNVYWLDMPDIAGSLEDVQVQRGAGSAFYGSPAIGGSVNLVTENFARERRVRLTAGVGSYNTRKYSASFSSGLIDERYALHGRLAKILSDGYRDRAWVDFDSYFLGMVRYDETMTTQLNFYGGPVADGLAYYGIPKEYVGDRQKRKTNPIMRNEEIENFSQPHYELLHEWQLGKSVTLNNTLFFIEGKGFFDYDGSWAPYSYYRIAPQYGFAVNGDPDTLYLPGALIRATVHNRQYGWLPRLTLEHGNGQLITGAEVRIHRSEHFGELQWSQELPEDVPRDYRYYDYNGAKDIISWYAHEIYRLRPDLTVMLDLQYVYNRYRLFDEKFVGTNFSVPYHFVNPRVGLNYNFDAQWNTYLSLAYTSREPRLKNLYDAAEASTPPSWGAVVPQFALDATGGFDFSRPLVKPESLFNIELGAGYRSDVVALTANLYWMEFTDEIVKSGQVDRFGQPITGNADRTRHLGLEVSARAQLLNGVDVRMNATVSRNRFVRHTDYSTGTPVLLNDNPIAGFPDLLVNARITWIAGDAVISMSGRYVGKQYTDNFRNEVNTVDPSVVSDAWILYTFRNVLNGVDLEAKLQVNNVFDALYASYGEGASFFVGAERNLFFNLAVSL